MSKPRIFLGSSGKEAELLEAISHRLEGVAEVELRTTAFNPGRNTLDRLVTSVRYEPATSAAEVDAIVEKPCNAIAEEGRRAPNEGLWWQLSLTMRTEEEPSAVSLLLIVRETRGRPGGQRPRLAGGRHALGPLLERSREGATRPGRSLLLLEGGAPPAPERSAARGHRRDPRGGGRPRERVMDHTVGPRRVAERPNLRRPRSRRPVGPGRPRLRERGREGQAHRATAPGVEVGGERLLSRVPVV
jgi:hypothetical protein